MAASLIRAGPVDSSRLPEPSTVLGSTRANLGLRVSTASPLTTACVHDMTPGTLSASDGTIPPSTRVKGPGVPANGPCATTIGRRGPQLDGGEFRHDHPAGRHARHRPQSPRRGRSGRTLRRRDGTSAPRAPGVHGRSRAGRGAPPVGARAESPFARTERPAGPGARGRSDAGRRLRRAAAGGALDGAVALPRPWRQRQAHSARADRQPVPRRRTYRELPARAAPQGVAHAAGQPAHRRRRRPRQDRRSGPDPHRAAVAAPYPAGPGPHAGLVAATMAGRAVGEVLTAVRGGRPAGDGAPAPRAWHGRHALALVQPHCRLVPLSPSARRARSSSWPPAARRKALRTCPGTC